jgi:anti-anti-sigma factor
LWFGIFGDLDVCSVGCAAMVLEAETDGRRCDVVLDLSGLEFVGLAGVEMLVEFARRIRSEDRMVHVTTNSVVDRVLQLSADQGRLALATGRVGRALRRWPGARRRPSSAAWSIAGTTLAQPQVAAARSARQVGAWIPRRPSALICMQETL